MSISRIEERSCLVNILDPAGSNEEDGCTQAVYWITSLVLGLLTLFIPHLIYQISLCCEPEPEKVAPRKPIPRAKVVPKSSESRVPLLAPVVKPSASLKKPPEPPKKAAAKMAPEPTTKVPVPLKQFIPTAKPIDFSTNDGALLKELQKQQKELKVVDLPRSSSSVMLLGNCRVSELASKARFAVPFDTSIHFSWYVPIAFRLDKSLRLEQFRDLMGAWPSLVSQKKQEAWSRSPTLNNHFPCAEDDRGCSSSLIDLRGSTQMLVDPSILVKNTFEALYFDGCHFAEMDSFVAALSEQKELKELSLGLDDPLSVNSFQQLTLGCPKLEKLTVAVENTDTLFTQKTAIKQLTLQVDSFSDASLNNIFSQNPELESLIVWCKNPSCNLRRAVAAKPAKLEKLEILKDVIGSGLKIPYQELVSGVKIDLTETDTSFLIASPFAEKNLWPLSFDRLLKRCAHDSQKLCQLLRGVAQQPSDTKRLFRLAESLADRLNWMDLAALEKEWILFEWRLSEAETHRLELLLRLALKICLEKHEAKQKEIITKGDTFHLWNGQVIHRILQQNYPRVISTQKLIDLSN